MNGNLCSGNPELCVRRAARLVFTIFMALLTAGSGRREGEREREAERMCVCEEERGEKAGSEEEEKEEEMC